MNDGLCRGACACTWLLSIQTTQLSPFLHNQGEIVNMTLNIKVRYQVDVTLKGSGVNKGCVL